MTRRTNTREQKRWLRELHEAANAESFPSGGSLILCESEEHAAIITKDHIAKGYRTITRGIYVLSTMVFK